MKSQDLPLRKSIGTATMVDPYQEFLEIINKPLVDKIACLLSRYGRDAYAVEYSFKQGMTYICPMGEHLKRMVRRHLKGNVAGYIPLGYFISKEEAFQFASFIDRTMRRRGIHVTIRTKTLRTSRSRNNRKNGKTNAKSYRRK